MVLVSQKDVFPKPHEPLPRDYVVIANGSIHRYVGIYQYPLHRMARDVHIYRAATNLCHGVL